MKKLIGALAERFQEAMPPNRVMLVVAGPITAASLWLSAWAAAHVPGANLPPGVIAGAMFVGGGILVTLIYRWFDQWVKGEPVHALQDAYAELERELFGTEGLLHGAAASLGDLVVRIEHGELNDAEVHDAIAALRSAIHEHLGVTEAPAAAVAAAPAPQQARVPTPTPQAPAP